METAATLQTTLPLVLWLAPGCAVVVAALYALAWRRATAEIAQLAPLTPAPLRAPLTVVIPARNEGARLGATLDALLREESPRLSVFVWDDASDDDTAEVVRSRAAKDKRLHLLSAGDPVALPAGVFGKPRALQRAMTTIAAQCHPLELVLFLDADVDMEPGALGGLVEVLEREGAVAVSGTPSLVLKSWAEELFVPAFVSLVGQRHPPSKVHDDAAPHAFLNGQCILVTKEALDAVGGFASVERTVLEDVALAHRLKRQGGRLRLADLRGVVATQMYASRREIFAGFGKNARPVLGGRAALVRTALLGTTLALVPWVALGVTGIQWQFALDGALTLNALAPMVVTTSSIGLILACGASVRTALGGRRWPVTVLPIVWGGVAFVLLRAAMTDRVTWKGRAYTAPETAPPHDDPAPL